MTNSRSRTGRAGRRRIALVVAGIAALVTTTVSACAGGGGSDDAAGSSAGALERTADDAGGDSASRDFGPLEEGAAGDAGAAEGAAGDADAAPPGDPAAAAVDLDEGEVIKTGTVSLRSDDVGKARRDVQLVVDRFRGSIGAEETFTDGDGDVESSRMVLRVPVASFDEVMRELEGTADMLSSDSGAEDVSLEVRDVAARIRAQEKSLQRVEALLARAEDLGEIVAIEAQLTRRQADLDALKSRQAYLSNQTERATITVHLEQAPEGEEEDSDRAGFLGGLADGWDGLRTLLGGVALTAGLLLPFLGLFLVIGVPLWLLLRPMLRRSAKEEAPPEGA